MTERRLELKFHGKFLDHLGIEAYQSPVASLAEIIANAWDADARRVYITLPQELGDAATITIKDDGNGMTFKDCQERYLNVGYNTREFANQNGRSPGGRKVFGRKGIGKFAGFGIANIIEVDTVSKDTGERTIFEMDRRKLSGSSYVVDGGLGLEAHFQSGSEEMKKNHGTTITLRSLTIKRNISRTQFPISMARRFLIRRMASDFEVFVNGEPLPSSADESDLEFVFPRDYSEEDKPANLEIEANGWGTEKLSNGETIKWRVVFYKKPIQDEELQGITVFANGKLAQTPFIFNIVGGVGGQHGLAYMSGKIEADYLDDLPIDPMSTERQRINWEMEEAIPLRDWGRERIKSLLRLRDQRRGEEKARLLEEKLTTFSPRLGKLQLNEQKVVKKVLTSVGRIASLDQDEFEDLGSAILEAWERGRLRDLITKISEVENLDADSLLKILTEADVLTALNVAEAAHTTLITIAGLKERIEKKELEVELRDFIGDNPWLISPKWETFQKEKSVPRFIEDSLGDSGIDKDEAFKGRIDIVLKSGSQLLLVEFMRPGLCVDFEHLYRFERYVTDVRVALKGNTGAGYVSVIGYIVADKLSGKSSVLEKIQRMRRDDMFAMDWHQLLKDAIDKWREFLEILSSRGGGDPRLKSLLDLGNIRDPNEETFH